MAVIRGPVAVNGNADLDLVLGEKLTETLVEQHPVVWILRSRSQTPSSAAAGR